MTVLLPPASTPVGRIAVQCEAGVPVLRLVGDIDHAAVEAFEARQPLPQAIGVVDLSEVTFLSSSGVGFLIRLTQPARAAGQPPVLRGLTGPAHRILILTGATGLFHSAA